MEKERASSEHRPWIEAPLALAHHRLGHTDEARRLAQSIQKNWRRDWYYDSLRREAVSTILYDSIFPADPFAR